jgi:hypothetical protein
MEFRAVKMAQCDAGYGWGIYLFNFVFRRQRNLKAPISSVGLHCHVSALSISAESELSGVLSDPKATIDLLSEITEFIFLVRCNDAIMQSVSYS